MTGPRTDHELMTIGAFARRTRLSHKALRLYDAVGRYLKDGGKSAGASPREVYFVAWDDVGDDDPACDVAFPYES